MKVKEKISELRKLMNIKNIDAWIIPSADPHQSEYVAKRWKTREWISGFTGSAGTVVISNNKAGLWTDSRYFLQAEKQLADSGIDLFKMGVENVPTYTEWLNNLFYNNGRIGFDGKLLSVSQVHELQKSFSGKNIQLEYTEDLCDDIWKDRPSVPKGQISIFDEKFAGLGRNEKITKVRKIIKETGADCHIVSALDEIAWVLNIRGNDIDYNPVGICYLYISVDKIRLFIKESKLPKSVRDELEKDGLEFSDYDDIFTFCTKLSAEQSILIDPNKISQKIQDSLPIDCDIIEKSNIISNMKSLKNRRELEGFRNAHIRDGVALVKWLKWLKENVGKMELDEVSVADKLEYFRSVGENYKGLSFETIAGYKANGAIIHYAAKPETAEKLEQEGLLLIDSGGQYLDGTTDITRTVSLGKPTDEERSVFTIVLKGHIDLAKAIFPKGYKGGMIDTFTRAALWENGYNYGHGTGHGIGHYLNVHEGPHQIRPNNFEEIKVGMVTSNEPGIYIEGKFGIRIENIIVTKQVMENDFGVFLGFDTISLCPIDLNLVDVSRLTKAERKWLNDYHNEVYDKLSCLLDDDEKEWLKYETRAI